MSMPMPKSEVIAANGTVQESLPNATFRVALDNGHKVLAHASGADVEKVTVKEAQEALRRWHVPANAVLSMVGEMVSRIMAFHMGLASARTRVACSPRSGVSIERIHLAISGSSSGAIPSK